jgi:hypothetical protein
MSGIIKKVATTTANKESLTTKLTLIIVGLTAGSGLLVPATYASLHPVTTGEIADNTILSVDIGNGQIRTQDIGAGQVRTEDIASDAIKPNIQIVSHEFVVHPNEFDAHAVNCTTGTFVSGGGFSATHENIQILASRPSDPDTWYVVFSNPRPAELALTVYALCIGPMP